MNFTKWLETTWEMPMQTHKFLRFHPSNVLKYNCTFQWLIIVMQYFTIGKFNIYSWRSNPVRNLFLPLGKIIDILSIPFHMTKAVDCYHEWIHGQEQYDTCYQNRFCFMLKAERHEENEFFFFFKILKTCVSWEHASIVNSSKLNNWFFSESIFYSTELSFCIGSFSNYIEFLNRTLKTTLFFPTVPFLNKPLKKCKKKNTLHLC